MSKSTITVARASMYLYLSSLIGQVLGYIFWLVMMGLIGAEGLGYVAAISSLSSLVVPLISLGISSSLARYLGEAYGSNDLIKLKEYLSSAIALTTIITLMTFFLIDGIAMFNVSLASYTPTMLLLTSAIILLFSLSTPFGALMIALKRTDLILLSNLVGGSLKIALGIMLVVLTQSWVGAAISYTIIGASLMVTGLMFMYRHLRPLTKPSLDALKDLLTAGLPVWLPGAIATVGQHFGTVAVFGFKGAFETGTYYVALTVSGILTSIPGSAFGVLVPTLAGLRDGRKRATWRAINVSLALVTPIAIGVAVYSAKVLSLLGEVYATGSPILSMLAITVIPQTISMGIGGLIYAYGMYRETLLLGMVTNVTRVVLYLTLTPLGGSYGAAIAMTTGTLAEFAASLWLSKGIGLHMNWRHIAMLLMIPVMLGSSYALNPPWILGILTIALSYVLYPRIGLLTREDLRYLAYGVLSKEVTIKVYNRFKDIIDLTIPP